MTTGSGVKVFDVSLWARKSGSPDDWERVQLEVERDSALEAIIAATQSLILRGKEVQTSGVVVSERGED